MEHQFLQETLIDLMEQLLFAAPESPVVLELVLDFIEQNLQRSWKSEVFDLWLIVCRVCPPTNPNIDLLKQFFLKYAEAIIQTGKKEYLLVTYYKIVQEGSIMDQFTTQ